MNEAIRIVPTSLGTSDWRVERSDGTYVCDIRIEISSMWNASRYYILRDGKLIREGTFNFRAWDDDTVREVLTALVKSMYANVTIAIDVPDWNARAIGP